MIGRKLRGVIDVTGRYVVPGFIDAHVHGDLMLLADPIHLPALRQGVTTYIIGQDGSSFAPAVACDARLHEAVHGRLQRQPGRPRTTGGPSANTWRASTAAWRSMWPI